MFQYRMLIVLFFLPLCLLSQQKKKVLIIGIDGCRADALQVAATPNIDALLTNSIQSYHAQNEDVTFSGPGWSAMLTGVWSPKHGVTDNSFGGSNFGQYPHFFKRIEDEFPALNTASISQWHPINNSIVLNEADFKYNAPTEADVTNEAVDQLSNFDPDVLFLHYDDVDHTGHSSGFSPTNPSYLSTIEGVDTQIGIVLQALYARVNYPNENWLILLSTDHGGLGTSHGGTSSEEETIFFIAHNKFLAQQLIVPDTIVSPNPTDCIGNAKHLSFDGDNDYVNIPHFNELDFGTTQDFTLECRIKTSTAADVAIVGNKDWDSGNNKGFVFSFKFSNGPEWKVNIGDGTNRVDINTGGAVADNDWHHLALTADRDGFLIIYEDGIKIDSVDMSGLGDISNGAPLRFAADINAGYDYNGAIEEVRLWDTILPESDLNSWQCQSVTTAHPAYPSLIGYWPLNEGSGNSVQDQSTNSHTGSITGASWTNLDTTYSFANTPRITDIAVSALDFLCVPILPTFNLDGNSQLPSESIVNTVSDNTVGSLRHEIIASCPGDSVTFANALVDATLFISDGEIILPHHLSIIGLGSDNLILSGENKNRIFNIPAGISPSIENLKLINGFAELNGGALLNEGVLTLQNVIFENNHEGTTAKAMTNNNEVIIKSEVEVKE